MKQKYIKPVSEVIATLTENVLANSIVVNQDVNATNGPRVKEYDSDFDNDFWSDTED